MILAGAGLAIVLAAPWARFTYHEVTLRNLTRQLGCRMEQTGWALMGLKTPLVPLANVVLGNCLALDYLLSERGGVCVITDTYRCTWINATGQLEVNIKEIKGIPWWSSG